MTLRQIRILELLYAEIKHAHERKRKRAAIDANSFQDILDALDAAIIEGTANS